MIINMIIDSIMYTLVPSKSTNVLLIGMQLPVHVVKSRLETKQTADRIALVGNAKAL